LNIKNTIDNLNKKYLIQNLQLKNTFNNQTCYILATGPSINEIDLSFLKNKNCISVSNFFTHTLINEINPIFHVFAPQHEPITREAFKNWIIDAHNKLPSQTNLFLHSNDLNLISSYNIERNIFEYLDGGAYPIDISKKIPPFQTVVQIAIYLAIYLGHNKIYLLGVDHDSLLNLNKSKHFYLENESVLVQSGYDEWKGVNLLKEFKSHVNLWEIYQEIKTNYTGEIINLNKNSFLDIFKKE
jgi:hypothetical protein